MSCEVQNKLLSSITSIAINYIDQIFTSYSGSEDMCLTMLRSLNLEVSPIAMTEHQMFYLRICTHTKTSYGKSNFWL